MSVYIVAWLCELSDTGMERKRIRACSRKASGKLNFDFSYRGRTLFTWLFFIYFFFFHSSHSWPNEFHRAWISSLSLSRGYRIFSKACFFFQLIIRTFSVLTPCGGQIVFFEKLDFVKYYAFLFLVNMLIQWEHYLFKHIESRLKM